MPEMFAKGPKDAEDGPVQRPQEKLWTKSARYWRGRESSARLAMEHDRIIGMARFDARAA